jgi:lipoprotein NlpD
MSVELFLSVVKSVSRPCLIAGLFVFAAGCATNSPAPVVHRAPATDPAEAKREFYTVGRGDTLSGIALRFGVTTAELIEWNGLSTKNVTPVTPLLQAGQVLRVKAQGVAVVTPPKPVAGQPSDQAQTSAIKPPPAVGAMNDATAKIVTKTGPRALKRPYSDATYAEMSRNETVPATTNTSPSSVASTVPPVPVVGASPVIAVPSDTKSVDTKASDTRESGGFIWTWPIQGKVVQNYNGTTSKSVLLAGEAGRPVTAAAKGTVLFAKEYQDYGKLVIVMHGTDLVSVYGQNNAISVKEGQVVERGQKIADQGPRLQFEIRRAGKPVDPNTFLPQR